MERQTKCKHTDKNAFSTIGGNFCDVHGKGEKSAILQDYARHMGYVDKSDHMINCTLLADRLGNGQGSYFSILWTLPLLIALSFLPLVVQNYHTDSSE
jgi:hypothetical protein